MGPARTASSLLLPHGHEGQGPEHTSARIERFLTLCAEDNMRVVLPVDARRRTSTCCAARARDVVEKPLVVMTPKSLLRHPRCVSTLQALAEGALRARCIDDGRVDPGARAARRAH